jgi:hypothetical protein
MTIRNLTHEESEVTGLEVEGTGINVAEVDSWIAARVRMYRLYRYFYRMGIFPSAWRALYTWFLWDVYDRIRYRIRRSTNAVHAVCRGLLILFQ